MRPDIFIIWGNGVSNLFPIIDIIREEGYEILNIKKHLIADMNKFIDDVYRCDHVPMDHLIGKTRYLLNSPRCCYTVYVNNHNVNEQYFGEGDFRHIQCLTIKNTKELIRNRFNPRIGSRRSEEHVIHGTDYVEQTNYLKTFFAIPDKTHHDYSNLEKITIDSSMLYCNIIGRGIIPVKSSPHYQFVLGNQQPYVDYITQHCGTLLDEDHLPGAFTKLINEFDISKSDGIIAPKRNGNHLIIDGLHRASIILAKTDRIDIYA